MDKTCKDIHTCSFCKKTSDEVEILVASPDDIFICNECIRLCEAVLDENDRGNIHLSRIDGIREKTKEKLRPITRIPKKWLVYKANPYAVVPYVTACDSSGEKKEKFSIPKQLARWIIVKDETVDIDRLKKDIKNEIIYTVVDALQHY